MQIIAFLQPFACFGAWNGFRDSAKWRQALKLAVQSSSWCWKKQHQVSRIMAVPENQGRLEELMQNVPEPRALKLVQWKSFRKGSQMNTSHCAAFCNACETAGVVFPEQGTCGGYQVAMDTHLKSCKNVGRFERDAAATRLAESKAHVQSSKAKRKAGPKAAPEQPATKFHAVPLRDIPLSAAEQTAVDKLLVEITVSANFALQWVDNTKVEELFALLRPAFKLPCRKTLSGRLLKSAVEDVEAAKLTALAQSAGALLYFVALP